MSLKPKIEGKSESQYMGKIKEQENNSGFFMLIKRWMRMNFNLLMNDWNYCNINTLMKKDDTLFHIIQIIKRLHPKCAEVEIFTDSGRLIDVFETLGEIYKTQGRNTSDLALNYQIYYDFKQGLNCPLLLF